MPLELQGNLLGLGSIVRVESESATGLFVVLARGAFRPDSDRNEVIPRYLIGPHPHGEAPDRETLPILASEVQEVVFEGYLDDADAAFIEDLLDQMENGRTPTTPARQFKDSLTAIPVAQVRAVEISAPAAAADPFAELRRVISQIPRKDEE